MLDRLEQAMHSAMAWTVAATLGGVAYLIRRVFTNQKQIEMLQQDLANRDRQRCEDRDRIREISERVRRVENWIIEDRRQ